MSLDSISETIAHFVGAFEITTEQIRLRDQYEEFVALRRKAELEGLEDPTKIKLKADLKLDPGEGNVMPFKSIAPSQDVPFPPAPYSPVGETVILSGPVAGPEGETPEYTLQNSTQTVIILEPEFTIELIGSAVTYTFQTVNLSDNDTIGQGDFREVESLMQQGEELLDTAMSLHATSAPSINIDDYLSAETVMEIADQMLTPMNPDVEGVTVHQFHGEDATGVIVNGEQVDEMPVWSDLLPEHHQTDDEAEDVAAAETPDPLPAEWDQSKDPDFDDGHTVVTGGNVAVNEVAVTVGWVDAPNIVVGGQSVNLTVINQVAVVSDIDEGGEGVQSTTNVVQSSQIEVEAHEAPWLETNVAESGEDPFVAVDWIDGDLIVANFINQVINATDIDQIHTEISATSSLYTLGDNIMSNVTSILQLGSFYDVIITGGDMISVDIVSQTIVLLDDDVITGDVESESNENLVMNQVSLTTTGEDTHEVLSENLASVLPLQELDTEALEDALMNDPTFAGTELVRVLKIEGDLLQVNVIEQVTLLQDQDDISVSGPAGEAVSAIGAGNAILNAANVVKVGVDSVIMAQEGEYSDVLLHQASLIDAPEEENAEIANEAIAFLMEEADVAAEVGNIASQIKLTPTEMASVDDGLQSMLT
ncbi:type I secretion protein [Ruegeria halocynthiae]|uniref:type I secretion protein n=1 Tax=Ruegeria halocynthiae TaxID=985054 RepID=UPI00055D1459|nr:type I secretion protein [Ruegeria halocynthiae]